MRSALIGLALTGLVIFSVSVAIPAQSAIDDTIGGKQLEIERLQNHGLSPEEESETAALLAQEQQRIAYEDVALPSISPGFGIAEDGSVVLRVYPQVGIDAVVEALVSRGLTASIVSSRYEPAEKDALEAALGGIDLEGDEAFGFAYDAIKDVVSVSGNVAASKVHAAVGDRLPYEFQHGDGAGRTAR